MPSRLTPAITLLVCFSYASLAHSDTPSASKCILNNDDVVVFCGDEFIANPDPNMGDTFPLLIETFLTVRYPNLNVHYHNVGWAGDSATRVGLRLERDVLSHQPTVVVICLGMNDPHYQPVGENPDLLETFRSGLARITKRCQDAGARVWLVSPPSVKEHTGQTTRVYRDGKPFFVDLAALSYNKTLAAYTAATAQIAATHKAGFINWFEAMTNARNACPADKDDFYAPRETRFPQTRGHALVAAKLLEAWGATPIHATIELNWKTGTSKVEVADIESHTASADVTIADDGRRILAVKKLPLPWPIAGSHTAELQPYWEAARLCQIVFKMTDPPKLGIKLERDLHGTGTQSSTTITAEQLKAGFNLAAVRPVRSIKEVQDLLKLIQLKNTYRYSAWRRLQLVPPQEPELAEPQQKLIGAWLSYAAGYEKIVARYPKTFDAKLILAEAVPDEQLPTARPTQQPKPKKGRKSRRTRTPQTTAPAQRRAN